MNAIHVGVCSWSLRPESLAELIGTVHATGLAAVQLALGPLVRGEWNETETPVLLRASGIRLLSGMMEMADEDYTSLESIRETGGLVPDHTWERNLQAAGDCAALAERLGLDLVTFHAGFIPEEAGPGRDAVIERLGTVADLFREHGVVLGLETGQESAETLAVLLDDLGRENLGVNFDPANMVLYGMGDPVDGLRRLAPWVRQIHIKDATPTDVPGTWGEEVAVGDGVVDWGAFFDVYRSEGLRCDLVIEREAGFNRIGDVRRAMGVVARELGG